MRYAALLGVGIHDNFEYDDGDDDDVVLNSTTIFRAGCVRSEPVRWLMRELISFMHDTSSKLDGATIDTLTVPLLTVPTDSSTLPAQPLTHSDESPSQLFYRTYMIKFTQLISLHHHSSSFNSHIGSSRKSYKVYTLKEDLVTVPYFPE